MSVVIGSKALNARRLFRANGRGRPADKSEGDVLRLTSCGSIGALAPGKIERGSYI